MDRPLAAREAQHRRHRDIPILRDAAEHDLPTIVRHQRGQVRALPPFHLIAIAVRGAATARRFGQLHTRPIRDLFRPARQSFRDHQRHDECLCSCSCSSPSSRRPPALTRTSSPARRIGPPRLSSTSRADIKTHRRSSWSDRSFSAMIRVTRTGTRPHRSTSSVPLRTSRDDSDSGHSTPPPLLSTRAWPGAPPAGPQGGLGPARRWHPRPVRPGDLSRLRDAGNNSAHGQQLPRRQWGEPARRGVVPPACRGGVTSSAAGRTNAYIGRSSIPPGG